MIGTHGKLLITAFIIILLGVVLIQPVADDIEEVKTSSVTVTNETLTFDTTVSTISNQTINLTSNITGTLDFSDLVSLTALRNVSSENLLGYCNITFATGALVCNNTRNATCYADYTYVSHLSETLANDELLSVDALRNITSENLLGQCNATLITGVLICNNTHNRTGYADYKYEPDTYVHSAAARTLLTVTILVFAIAILAVGAGFVIAGFKQGGVM